MDKRVVRIELLVLAPVTQECESLETFWGAGRQLGRLLRGLRGHFQRRLTKEVAPPTRAQPTWGSRAPTGVRLPASLTSARGRRPPGPTQPLGAPDLQAAEVRPRTRPSPAPALPPASGRSEPFGLAERPVPAARSAHQDA